VKYVTAGLLLVGLVLLGVIILQTDLNEVQYRLGELGGEGIAIIVGLYLLKLASDGLTWHLTLPAVPLKLSWFYRLSKVMLVGEAFNRVTPLGAIGSEPIKAVLVKKHYRIGYRETTASLILIQTVANIALVGFLLVGLLLLLTTQVLPVAYQFAASVGMAIFSVLILLFFLVQRYKVFSRIGGWLGQSRLRTRLLTLVELTHDLEERLIAYYTGHRRRFAVAVATAFLSWLLGMLEVYCAFWLLGHKITLITAWVIEANVALMRALLFFVPGHIGTQEGTLVVMSGIITGSPTLGFAVAVIVRCREMMLILWGLALAWYFSLSASGLSDEKFGTVESP
jgi:uncharacterized membrane protein YbhN (UPF0104 family)